MFVEALMSLDPGFFGFLGHFIVFIALFLEALPFIGAFIPGGIPVLLAAGLFAKLGYFNFWLVALVAVIASVSADCFGYFSGNYMRRSLFEKSVRFLFFRRKMFDRVGCALHEHTGKSLIFCKMNPVTRSIAPFVVGSEEVPFKKFFLFSVVGSVIWVFIFLGIGYLFGTGFQSGKSMEIFVLITTVLLIGGLYVYYLSGFFKPGIKRYKGYERLKKLKRFGKNGADC